jgi:hypothetical protein
VEWNRVAARYVVLFLMIAVKVQVTLARTRQDWRRLDRAIVMRCLPPMLHKESLRICEGAVRAILQRLFEFGGVSCWVNRVEGEMQMGIQQSV